MSIKLKLYFVLVFTFLSMCGFGFLSYTSYEKSKAINQDLRQAAKLNGLVLALANSPFYRSLERKISAYSGALEPSYRQEIVDKIIVAYKTRDRVQMNKAIVKHRKQDKRYVSYLEENYELYKYRMETYALALAGIMFFSLLLVFRLVTVSVLKPLKVLSKRMIDFLNNRYTYQFRVPKKNEVGEVELNFHSLAQRVLNNIEELKALDSAKSDFLNIASHELRTPLTSIKGSLSLLKTGLSTFPPEKSAKLFEIAENETDRLIRLINDLLDLAKIEAGKLPLEKDWIAIDELIEKTLYSLEGISKTAKVSLAYKSGQFKLVEVDQDKVQQVLTNLVSNAIKYSPDNGTVTVHVEIDKSNHLRIEIRDQGEGISPDDQKLIFEKFRQATGPSNPIVKGTGLGLAIARAVIEEHDGVIGVHSQLGKGSTFYFTLPEWRQDEITIDFKEKKLRQNQGRHLNSVDEDNKQEVA